MGSSLAVVQGSKRGSPQYPILLVTSCFANGTGGAATRATLYFLDPLPTLTGKANVVNTMQTKLSGAVNAPGNGWAELVLAPDKAPCVASGKCSLGGVFLGCGTDGSLYTIDYAVDTLQTTPTNLPVADGTATLVTTKPSAATSCTGLAWDPSDNTIYQSTGGTIYHFGFDSSVTPPSTAMFNAPAGCTVSGLSVVGGVLLVACNGTATVYRLDKGSGAPIADLPPKLPHTTMTFKGSPAPALADLECDPVTFGGADPRFTQKNIDAVWSKLPGANQVQAFWVPPGTCGLPPTGKVFAPGACPDLASGATDTKYRKADGSPVDTDGDGLWDCWEDKTLWAPGTAYAVTATTDGSPGIDFDGDGVRDLALCVNVDTNGDGTADTPECADPNVKDIFVEVDYMQFHKPDAQALLNVRSAFLNAPVANPSPSFPTGIKVHFQVDEQIGHNNLVALEPCTAPATPTNGAWDFDLIKSGPAPGGGPATGWFGTATERSGAGAAKTLSAKRLAFRYMAFVHNLSASGSSTAAANNSGCSEVPGDDSVIAMGGFSPTADAATGHQWVGNTDEQAGTVMHELGHNLGLRHGGGDNVNCKPNYLSVMNYSRQLPNLIPNRRLDYSRDELPMVGIPLSEVSLSEDLGIGVPSVTLPPLSLVEQTVFSVPGTYATTVKKVSIGGTFGTAIDWDNDAFAGGESVSNQDINKLSGAGCDGKDGAVSAIQSLPGYNDWAKLQYNARASIDFAGGHTATPVEHTDQTSDQSKAAFEADFDADGVSDAHACGIDVLLPPLVTPDQDTPCAIDVKPGTTPKVLSKKGDSNNVGVAILSTPSFYAPGDVVNTAAMRLNGEPPKLNQNGQGTCSIRDVNGDGIKDLICQFTSAGLAIGRNFATLEFQVSTAQCGTIDPCFARARQLNTVVK